MATQVILVLNDRDLAETARLLEIMLKEADLLEAVGQVGSVPDEYGEKLRDHCRDNHNPPFVYYIKVED